MSYSYDYRREASISLRQAALKDGPAGKVLDKWWNKIHDLEAELQTVLREYDSAASYRGGPGEREARAVMDALASTQKQLKALANSGGAFDQLWKAESKFTQKHGSPEDYAEMMRDKIYSR